MMGTSTTAASTSSPSLKEWRASSAMMPGENKISPKNRGPEARRRKYYGASSRSRSRPAPTGRAYFSGLVTILFSLLATATASPSSTRRLSYLEQGDQECEWRFQYAVTQVCRSRNSPKWCGNQRGIMKRLADACSTVNPVLCNMCLKRHRGAMVRATPKCLEDCGLQDEDIESLDRVLDWAGAMSAQWFTSIALSLPVHSDEDGKRYTPRAILHSVTGCEDTCAVVLERECGYSYDTRNGEESGTRCIRTLVNRHDDRDHVVSWIAFCDYNHKSFAITECEATMIRRLRTGIKEL